MPGATKTNNYKIVIVGTGRCCFYTIERLSQLLFTYLNNNLLLPFIEIHVFDVKHSAYFFKKYLDEIKQTLYINNISLKLIYHTDLVIDIIKLNDKLYVLSKDTKENEQQLAADYVLLITGNNNNAPSSDKDITESLSSLWDNEWLAVKDSFENISYKTNFFTMDHIDFLRNKYFIEKKSRKLELDHDVFPLICLDIFCEYYKTTINSIKLSETPLDFMINMIRELAFDNGLTARSEKLLREDFYHSFFGKPMPTFTIHLTADSLPPPYQYMMQRGDLRFYVNEDRCGDIITNSYCPGIIDVDKNRCPIDSKGQVNKKIRILGAPVERLHWRKNLYSEYAAWSQISHIASDILQHLRETLIPKNIKNTEISV